MEKVIKNILDNLNLCICSPFDAQNYNDINHKIPPNLPLPKGGISISFKEKITHTPTPCQTDGRQALSRGENPPLHPPLADRPLQGGE